MSTLETSQAAMAQIGNDLQIKYTLTLAEVTGSFAFDGNVKDQVLAAVRQTGQYIQALVTVKRDQVLAGTRTFANWAGLAKTYHDALQYYAKDIGAWTWGGVVSNTLVATGQDIQAGADAALSKSTPTLVLVLLIVVALIVLRFSI